MKTQLILRGLVPLVCGFVLIVYAVYLYSNPQVEIDWETASELDTVGFFVFRSLSENGPFEKITSTPVLSSGDPLVGSSYRFTDTHVQANIRYYYQLVEIESTGKQNILGVTSVLPGHTGLIEGSAGIVCIVVGVILLKIPGTNYGKPIYGRV